MQYLSSKQSCFLSNLLKEGKTQTEAAMDAYNLKNRKSAAVQGSRLMRNKKVEALVNSFFAKASVDGNDLALALKAGLRAKKIFRTSDGTLEESVFNDYRVQHKYLKVALRLLA